MQLLISLVLPLSLLAGAGSTDLAPVPQDETCEAEPAGQTRPAPTAPTCTTDVGPVYTCTTCKYAYSTTVFCKPNPKQKLNP